jgi:hypothetical protein
VAGFDSTRLAGFEVTGDSNCPMKQNIMTNCRLVK